MEEVRYKKQQIDNIIAHLNNIEVKGYNSVTQLAIVFQELNKGEVLVNNKDGDLEDGSN